MRRSKINKASSNTCKTVICVLENPTNIGNVGAIVRTANCLGVAKIYVIDSNNLLPENWNIMRTNSTLNGSSCGSVKWTYVKKFLSTEECFNHLIKNRYTSVATSPHTNENVNINLLDGEYTDNKLAIWFGNEIQGLSDEVIKKVSRCIQIPMYGITESLNLAVCSGIVLHEVVRQRRNYLNLDNHVFVR